MLCSNVTAAPLVPTWGLMTYGASCFDLPGCDYLSSFSFFSPFFSSFSLLSLLVTLGVTERKSV